jgi:hypothetical protein
VPHSGWRCTGIDDDKRYTCEMCEVTEISYSHIMVHDALPGVELRCGYVCAAHMTGNAEQERLREVHYAWLAAVRANRTPIQKLKRKSWRGDHSVSGVHEWTMHVDDFCDWFRVEVKNADGWRYSLRRHWWVPAYGAPVLYLHGGPFESDVEAAVAGISHAELLLADSRPFCASMLSVASSPCQPCWRGCLGSHHVSLRAVGDESGQGQNVKISVSKSGRLCPH